METNHSPSNKNKEGARVQDTMLREAGTLRYKQKGPQTRRTASQTLLTVTGQVPVDRS